MHVQTSGQRILTKGRVAGATYPLYTWFLGPTRVHAPDGISIGSSVFVGLAVGLADRQTPYRQRMAASDDVRQLSVVLVNCCYSAPLNLAVTVHGNAMARFHIEGGPKKVRPQTQAHNSLRS